MSKQRKKIEERMETDTWRKVNAVVYGDVNKERKSKYE